MKVKKMLAVLLAALFVLTSCGKTTDKESSAEVSTEEKSSTEESSKEITKEEKEVEIIFWHAMNGGQEEALTSLTESFMNENPNIKVTLQNQANYGDLSQKITSTMQSPKNLPTITQAYPDWLVGAIKEGLVVDLTSYIDNADKAIALDNKDDILEGLRKGVEIDGGIYGMPFNKSTEVLWYNKTLFDELQLEVPKTFEELKEVSKTIFEKKNIAGVGFDSLSNYYTTYLQNKGVAFDENLDVTGDLSKEACNYYFEGIKGGYFRIAGTDKYLSGPFGNEQVAMYVGSNAGETYVKEGVSGKFEYAVAPYPAEQSVQQGTDIYMFNEASEEQKSAAWEYLKYLTSKDAQVEWATKTGYMPIRKSAIESDAYKNSDSAIAPILAEATKNLYSRPLKDGSQTAYNDVGAMLEALLSSPDNDVEDALNSFKETFESAWK